MTKGPDGNTDAGNNPLLDRRSYIKGVAGVGATVAAGMSAAAGSSGDYEEIVVGAGDTYTKTLSDGETWENVLIDISARGAQYRIHTQGASNWTIRNIGVRGEWDDPVTKVEPFVVSDPDPNGESVIENIYLPGTGPHTLAEARSYDPGSLTGIFVPPGHAGDILMKNLHIRWCRDNAVYASPPGNSSDHPAPGAGGTIRFYDSFARACGAGMFRIGTDGSYAKNCVANGADVNGTGMGRGLWGFFQHTEAIDCDFTNAEFGDVSAGSSAWAGSRNATVSVTNTYYESTAEHGPQSQINGSSADREPRTKPEQVEGVPLSPEEAASGSPSSSGSSSPPSTDTDPEPVGIDDVWNEDGTNEIVLRSDGSAEYRFDGNGVAELGEYADTNEDDPYRDTVAADGDAFTIEGHLGGFRDDFTVEGEIVAVEIEGTVTATVNGEEFDPEELEGVGSWDIDGGIESVWRTDEPNHVELNGGSPEDIAEYRIDGNGLVETGEYADTDPDNPYTDTVTTDDDGFTIEGYVAGFRDDFEIEGAVTDVESDQTLTAMVNGHEFDFTELEGVGSWDDEADDETNELPHELVIDGSSADGSTSYRFSVTGDLVSTGGTGSAADDASVDGQSAEGTVEDGEDSYRFSGNITGFWMAGEASVDLDFGE